jgi:hypothetical protein
MQTIVLDTIPFTVDRAAVRKTMGLPAEGSSDGLDELAAAAEKIARPRVAFKLAYIDSRDGDLTVIDGITFTSRVLRVNLDPVHRVFPHVVTCGREIESWSEAYSDPLEMFAADAIKEQALGAAFAFLQAHLGKAYGVTAVSHMNPGSLPDWPLPQQVPLFQLLGDVEALIGVHLKESFLMVPTKTVSGIFFPTESRFESCQLCPREDCPGRRAPYDAALFQSRYGQPASHG